VLVRRRADAGALEATLVSRRPGVPHTTTSLPSSLLDMPVPMHGNGATARPAPVPMGPGIPDPTPPLPVGTAPAAAAPVAPPPTTSAAARSMPAIRPPAAEFVLVGGVAGDPPAGWSADRDEAPTELDTQGAMQAPDPGGDGRDGVGGDHRATARHDHGAGGHADDTFDELIPRPPVRVRVRREVARVGARRASDVGVVRTIVRRAAAESLALLTDLGLPAPDLFGSRGLAKPSEVLARGPEAGVVERVASRVQSAFGLSHTLTAPLRTEHGVIGAIVLSRRDRHAWPESARRLVRGAAGETAAALARADTYREATAGASTDPLTGLPNRRYFDEFASLLSTRRRAGDAVAVLMIDIDRFKVLNDTYGHPTGDQVLRAVSGAITAAVREQDVPARMGGEEFAVLLRNPGTEVALEIGERVRQAVRGLDLSHLGVRGVSVSVGVADARNPDESVETLVDRADRALLRAKRAGRDRVIAG
jgi:diguanylate cyclase (GGDEF)-like protein